MSDNNLGVGGLTYDKKKRDWPSEVNVLFVLIGITIIFELIGRIFLHDSFLFNTRADLPDLFNNQRLAIIIAQVSIIGILAIGVTQVIISGGIDLSSGSIVGATAMITMSFAQTALVNDSPNPTAMFHDPRLFDLPVMIPVIIGICCGVLAGLINGWLIAYTGIPPFIATLGMFASARGLSSWWTRGKPVSFPIDSYKAIGAGIMPVVIFITLAILFQLILTYTKYGRHCYAVGSNEEAARVSGVNITGHKILVYTIAATLAAVGALVVSSKNLTAQAGMGTQYELQAIAMAVIGGVSLKGGRGTIVGTVLGALILGVITSGFTFMNFDAYYQLMALGVIIVGAVVLDEWQQRRKAGRR